MSWWARKGRQFLRHLTARVRPDERASLAAWLRPAELALFDAMHVADRRHGLDVVAAMRRAGVTDRNVLAAGLLHDCAKGDTGVGPRVAWSLGEAFGPRVHDAAARLPGWGASIERLRNHAEASAAMVEAAGLPPFAVDLVRYQSEPRDPEYGRVFQLADEAA
jgi:HD domain